MKTNKLHILTAIIFIIATSCAKEEPLNSDQTPQTVEVQLTDAEMKVLYQMRNENNKVGIEEATQFANDVIGFLDGETAVKSGTARSISSVGALISKDKPIALKSSDDSIGVEIPDTVAYIFNFGEEDGFAIVSADTRIEDPILAYTGDGALSAEKEVDNPGLILFLEGTEDYIVRSIVDAEQRRDSLIGDIIAKLDLDEENESGTKATNVSSFDLLGLYTFKITTTAEAWTTTSRVYPLSSVEWGQGRPYNQAVTKLCSNKDGGRAPVGCVATVTAQIMAYWQHPASINGVNFDWTMLNRYTANPNDYDNVRGKQTVSSAPATFNTQVANLMVRIGSNIGMSYGCDGSGAKTENAVNFLKQCGYSYLSGSSGLSYDYNTVISSLQLKLPVIIDGYSYKTTKSYLWGLITSTSYSGGHCWIVDGYLNQQQKVTTKIELIRVSTRQVVSQSTSTYYNYASYLHNNWGWNGGANGYYVAGSFNSNATEVNSSTKSGEYLNFQYNIKIFPFIYR